LGRVALRGACDDRAAHGVGTFGAITDVDAARLSAAVDVDLRRGVERGRRVVSGRGPAAGQGGGTGLSRRGAEHAGRAGGDDVSAGLQTVKAVDAAVVRRPIPPRVGVAHGATFRVPHAHGAHARQSHRVAAQVEHAPRDNATLDHSERDGFARAVERRGRRRRRGLVDVAGDGDADKVVGGAEVCQLKVTLVVGRRHAPRRVAARARRPRRHARVSEREVALARHHAPRDVPGVRPLPRAFDRGDGRLRPARLLRRRLSAEQRSQHQHC
jgi:hypothetical protein